MLQHCMRVINILPFSGCRGVKPGFPFRAKALITQAARNTAYQ